MEKNAEYYIEKLALNNHLEGGAFKETYRSKMVIANTALNENFKGITNASTAVYFLLQYNQFSAFHKIASDEVWHFYAGNTLTVYEIESNGNLLTHKLGTDLENGETFQCIVRAGNWFGSRCEVENGFSLVGCTVAPGFNFTDLIIANRTDLINTYPQIASLISEMTY
jgi:hypothetical protein